MITVSGGEATLDQAYAHIFAGLPYVADLETLDIDTPQGPSLKETNIAITTVGLWVQASRGIWVGGAEPSDESIDGLRELKVRVPTQVPADPPPLITDFVKQPIRSEWNSHGRIFVRQIDPIPLNVLAAIPMGFIPDAN